VSVTAPPALRIARPRNNPRRQPISLAPICVIDPPQLCTAAGMPPVPFHLHDAQAGIVNFCAWHGALPRAAVLPPARQLVPAQSGSSRPFIRGWVA
jgi:hypothetical protein